MCRDAPFFIFSNREEKEHMNGLPLSMVQAVSQYEPIWAEGLRLFPIRVREFETFSMARAAIEFMQQSLPVALMSKPLLQAFYTLEFEAAAQGKPSVGLLYQSILFLILAMRVGEDKETGERMKYARICPKESDPRVLDAIIIGNERRTLRVTPVQFQRIRPILAAQNGIELVSENANPELVQAERDLAEMNAPKLDYRLESMMASIALVSGADEAEMYDWPILKLMRRKEALQRMMGYLVCGVAEAQGAKWKGRNPFPSPLFSKEDNGSGGVIAMENFAGGAGMRAVQNAGNRTT